MWSRSNTSGPAIGWRQLTGGVYAAIGMYIVVVVSALRDDSALGVPLVWPWLLTGLQALAPLSAGAFAVGVDPRRHGPASVDRLGGDDHLNRLHLRVCRLRLRTDLELSLFYSFLRNSTVRQPMEVLT